MQPVIYGITSPVSHKVRIVGQSTRSLDTRLIEHKSHALNGKFVCQAERDWMQALVNAGYEPGIIVLEEVALEELDSKEIWWIAKGLELKWPLLNENKGGKGKSRIHKTEPAENIPDIK